uniref:PDZ domain containing ring finger 4 n=1 Tax=Neogobius melanostomus TaxID=47308 RepID=A0A8C6UPI8_9GOBI
CGRPHGSPQEIHVVDVCTQTDITFEHIMALAKLRPSTPPVPDSYLTKTSRKQIHRLMDRLAEVELCRLNSQEKLGLTLCYRTDEEEDVAIYVSEICPNSIAAKDGRIREGDRILQVQHFPSSYSAFMMSFSSFEFPTRRDSSENVLAQIQRRLSQCLRDRDTHRPSGSTRLDDRDEDEEGDRFQQLLELKCQIRNSGEYDLFYSRRSTIECSVAEQGSVQHELRMLNDELRSIELECQNIMQAHKLRKGQQSPSTGHSGLSSKNQSLKLGDQTRSKLTDINERLEKSDKDSSSAYNTAESSRSTPLQMDRSPEHSLQRISLTNQRNLCSGLAMGHSSPVPPLRLPVLGKGSSPDHSNPSESDHAPQPEEDKRGSKAKASVSQIPYFSPSHSSQQRQGTIPAHARHYQSYMQLIQQRSAVEYAQSQLSLLSLCKEPQLPEPKMEWKVKIRSDGTRYITKRPVRDKILKERALKIKEERSGGMTTDDDAISEMKMGRYWSKEERKQHLVRAKEQRQRREFMQRSRLESLKENPQSSSEARKEVSIIELSQKKMMKKRNKKILDNWMTIQELMTHGTKAPEGAKVHNAFLSVTTV